jgi:mannose-6-phosphate isomerase
VLRIALLENPIREYDWGSRSAIAELTGQPSPSAAPQAELWMGAHPSAPSAVAIGGMRRSLLAWIEENPQEVLGARVQAKFGGRLPFLLKVLAADRPLSIQAHPDAAQARDGFARENAAGIPLDAAERCYRDPNHKPELLCALTPFWALRGFRAPHEVLALAARLGVAELDAAAACLRAEAGGEALAAWLRGLFALAPEARMRLVRAVARAAAERGDADIAFEWIPRLQQLYRDDVGVLAPLFLHAVRLEPGEAIYLPARELHSYLQGVGIELMASSDNVLRGGLTTKPLAVGELLRVLRFGPARPVLLRAQRDASGWERYATPALEFELARATLRGGAPLASAPERGIEILLCTEGAIDLAPSDGREGLRLAQGQSCVVPASAPAYRASGHGALYRASVPSASEARSAPQPSGVRSKRERRP